MNLKVHRVPKNHYGYFITFRKRQTLESVFYKISKFLVNCYIAIYWHEYNTFCRFCYNFSYVNNVINSNTHILSCLTVNSNHVWSFVIVICWPHYCATCSFTNDFYHVARFYSQIFHSFWLYTSSSFSYISLLCLADTHLKRFVFTYQKNTYFTSTDALLAPRTSNSPTPSIALTVFSSESI